MSQAQFVYHAQPNRVVFGSGTLPLLAEELRRLEIRRALVLCTPQQTEVAENIFALLGELGAGVCARAVMHTPVEATALALEDLQSSAADGLVSVGGGSTIGLGKALSVRTGLPHVAVPTTYAGSEMTPILGETENGVKTTRRAPEILPAATLYDVDLSLGLPRDLSTTSGLNAIAHAVEALYAPDGNPIVGLMAEESIRSLAHALRAIHLNPGDREARHVALYGSWLAGTCLGSVSMSVHHKLCHTLGGTFDLPHAETHAVVLPYVLAFVEKAVPETTAAIRRALACEAGAPAGLQDLAREIGAPRSLAEIGMPEDGIELAAQRAVANPYWSPVPLDLDAALGILRSAYDGRRLH